MADVQAVDVCQTAEQLVHVQFYVHLWQVPSLLTAHLVQVVLVVLHHHVKVLQVLLVRFFARLLCQESEQHAQDELVV